MNPLYPNGEPPRVVALAGDWHGDGAFAFEVITTLAGQADVIVHLGDFGFWTPGPTSERFISRVTRTLKANDLQLVFVDGNHEWHPGLLELPVNAHGLRKVTNNIWHLPRGFRWRWGENTWMALGGAHSIDRQWRTEGVDWWPQETLTEADVEYASRPGDVDVIVSHDAPARAKTPLGKGNWPRQDIDRSIGHREMVQRVVDKVQPKQLWHGHFHVNYTDTMELASSQVCVVNGLADNISGWRNNTRLVGLEGSAWRQSVHD